MRHPAINPSFYEKNRQAILKDMQLGSVAVIAANKNFLHNADSIFPFMQNSDFLYLTGLHDDECILVLEKNKQGDMHAHLFLAQLSKKEQIWHGNRSSFEEASKKSGLSKIRPIQEFEETFHLLAIEAKTLYLYDHEHPHARRYETAGSLLLEKLLAAYPLHPKKRLAALIHRKRMIKTEEELWYIEKAIAISLKGLEHVAGRLRPGASEYALEAELSYAYLKEGSLGFAFQPIIAGGDKSCILHYIKNWAVLKEGSHVLIDSGARYGDYNADITRFFPISASGRFSARQKAVYQAVLNVKTQAESLLAPGLSFATYKKKCLIFMCEQLLALGLFKDLAAAKKECAQYFMHGISHFLGIDVHDVGSMQETMQAGMLLTVEPGIYIQEEGLGIRLEDDVLVTATGSKNLSASIPLEIDAVEEMLNK